MKEFWILLTPWQKFKLLMSVLLAVFTVIFAIVNWQETEVNFIFFKVRISITLLMFICLTVGYLSSSLIDYRKYRKKEKEILSLKAELDQLKQQP